MDDSADQPPKNAPDPILLTDELDFIGIGKRMLLLEDPEGTLDFQAVLSPAVANQFQVTQESQPNFGYSNSAYWVWFTLENNSYRSREWWVECAYPLIDSLQFHTITENGEVSSVLTGDRLPFAERPIDHRNFVFPITIAPGQSLQCYARIRSTSTIDLPFQLWTPKSFNQANNQSYIFFGIYYGIILVMVFYNLFLAITIRERAYLYYIFCIASIGLFQLAFNGVGFQMVWRSAESFNHQAIPFSVSLIGLTFLPFNRRFLQTRAHLPTLDRVLQVGSVLFGVLLVCSLFITPNKMMPIVIIFGLMCVLLSFTAGGMSWRVGVTHARFYILAWMAFLIGMSLNAFRALGMLPSNFFTIYGSQIGSALEVILLGIALGDRINGLQEEVTQQRLDGERLKVKQEEEKKRIVEAQKTQLELQVKERTVELEQQTEELQAALDMLTRSNRKVTDSMQYARRIQSALIPDPKALGEALPQHFIIYRPKDIVSGDFYWFAEREDRIIVAVVDCTGHGVPGALMSVVGASMLDKIVNLYEITKPCDILQALHTEITHVLHQEEGGSKQLRDGMDLAIISIDKVTNHLTFSGARNSLYLVKEGAFTEIKGDKLPVGGRILADDPNFCYREHDVKIEPGLSVYLATDGYADQFGGAQDKKFSRKRLRELIQNKARLPIGQQAKVFTRAFEDWKGDKAQIDDVTLLGIRF